MNKTVRKNNDGTETVEMQQSWRDILFDDWYNGFYSVVYGIISFVKGPFRAIHAMVRPENYTTTFIQREQK